MRAALLSVWLQNSRCGRQTILLDQAENRLDVQRAVPARLLRQGFLIVEGSQIDDYERR